MKVEKIHLSDQQLIHRGPRFWTYRTRWSDQFVVVKTLRLGGDLRGLADFLKIESDILQNLNAPGVSKLLAVHEIDGRPALILQDAGKENLADHLLTKKISIANFYDFSITLSEAISYLHEKNLIHRDINPSNIVLGALQQPTLIDFELATSISGTQGGIPGAFEGALLYMAPEQTGRMDRLVDHRTDLYSLGATLYHALTGHPPFHESNPIELVRMNLAVMPKSPQLIDPTLPPSLVEIIMKLLSKMPEHRYQSSKALIADLKESKHLWQKGSVQTFELGREDLVQMLPFPETLYGRDKEMLLLKNILDNVNRGSKEFILLSGVAGIGKTALVDEIGKLLSYYRIMKGKCDQLRTEVPYAALAEACQNQVRSLLSLPRAQVEAWAKKINDALSPNGRVLTEMIPELENLIGPQPAIANLGPVETENRLHLTFKIFFHVLTENENVLMLFLDDLQWADQSSVRLLKTLIADPEIGHLLIIGAYRSEEVHANHLLNKEFTSMRSEELAFHKLNIEPLSVINVAEFIRDLLRTDLTAASTLAEIIHRKTAGNPFFIKRLLRYLQKTELLMFDIATNQWQWDVQQIENVEVSENVVDLMIRTVRELPEPTQKTLSIMASIGHSTDLDLLAASAHQSREDIGRTLWPAIHEQLLIPVRAHTDTTQERSTTVAYNFVHDRVQQAVYSLLPENEKTKIHYSIGTGMLESLTPEQLESRIFEVTDQLNLGENCLTAEEKIKLADLNCKAGQKARTSAAFDSSLRYFKRAILYLGNNGWTINHKLMFQAHLSAAECSFLIGETANGIDFAEKTLAHAKTNIEKIDVYSLRVIECSLRGDFKASIEWGKQGLAILGFSLPHEDFSTTLLKNIALASEAIADRSIDELLALPDAHDPEVIASIRLFSELLPPAWFSNPLLWPYLNLQIVLLSINHGYNVSSATGFAAYAMLLATNRDYKKSHMFGQFSIALTKRFGNTSKESEVLLLIADFVNHWQAPFSETQALFRMALAKALESGNLQYAAFIKVGRLAFWSFSGMNLDSLSHEAVTAIDFSHKVGSRPMIEMATSFSQISQCLLGATTIQGKLESESFNEAQFLNEAQNDPPALACYALAQLQAAFFFKNMPEANNAIAWGEKLMPYIQSFFPQIEFNFYAALALAAQGNIDKFKSFANSYDHWAQHCPENFQHRHLILQAEAARLENQPLTSVLNLYENAIEAAARAGFIQDEAITCELCGRLFHANHIYRLARVYIKEACEKYSRWGAKAKVDALREEFFELTKENISADVLNTGTDSVRDTFVDLFGLLKSVEKISSELVLNRLLEQLFEISLQVAGAQRGALILKEKGELVVRAFGSTAETLSVEKTFLTQSNQISIPIVEKVFETGETIVLADAARVGLYINDAYIAKNKIKSVLAVPIVRTAKQIGVFYFENNLATRAFTASRVESLNLLSAQIAVSLENSLLFEKLNFEIQERTKAERSAQFLAEISVVLSESLDYEQTLKKVANMATPDLADCCTVDIVTTNQHKSHIDRIISESADPQMLNCPSAISTQTTEPYLVTSEIEPIKQLGMRSILAIPLIARNRVMGALTLYSRTRGKFNKNDFPFFEEMARRCAMAIENAHLYAEAQKSIQLRDDFIAIASHELRTPLTPMKMQAQLLKRYLSDTQIDISKMEQLRKLVDGTDRQIERLTVLVEDMLDVSRMGSSEIVLSRNPCNLSQLVSDIVTQIKDNPSRNKSKITTQIAENIIGNWDCKRLEQVVTNLITNAIKYGLEKPIEISLFQENHSAIFKVKDLGIGIAKDDVPKLFARFVRVVPVKHYGGFGLGLYIVRRIVEAHGGDIMIESELNHGSTFIVRLPLN